MMTPQKDSDEFYKTVGYCVTAWAKVEEHLFDVCRRCLQTTSQLAAIVYYRTPMLDARLSLASDLVKSAFPKEPGEHDHDDFVVWTKLSGDIRDGLKTRRRIVHHPVRELPAPSLFSFPDIFAVPNLFASTWLEIYISESEQLRAGAETAPLSLIDVQAHYATVLALSDRLRLFATDALPKHILTSVPTSTHSPQSPPATGG